MSGFEIANQPARTQIAPARKTLQLLRSWLASTRGLIILAIALVGGGFALGWNWLVAAGIAPLILSAAPCLALYALGACMMMKGTSSSGDKPKTEAKREPQDSAAANPSNREC